MKKNATIERLLDQGTYARNPVSAIPTGAPIDEIENGHMHDNIVEFGTALMKSIISHLLNNKKVDDIVQGYPREVIIIALLT